MSRHGEPKSTLCVDALLPSLGALSVNTRSDAAALQGIGLSRDAILLLEDGDAIEAEAGQKRKIGEGVTDPKDGKPASWRIPKKDAQGNVVLDAEGNQVFEFNEGLHKRLLWKENESWREWYPPTPPEKEPHEYPYESGWTSFYPSGRNITVKHPHWLNKGWPSKRDDTLAKARIAFADTLSVMLKDYTGNDATQKNAQQKEDMTELRKIMEKDKDGTDTSKGGTLKANLFRLRALLADRQPLSNRSNTPFPLPPGWLPLKKRISPEKLEKNARENQSVGKYAEVFYVGTQWSEWKAGEARDFASLHLVYSEKSVVQSWLIYLNYQTSASTNDQGELARKNVEGAAEAHEANQKRRKRQMEKAQAARDEKKASNEEASKKRLERTSDQRQEVRQDQEELERMDPSRQNADGAGSSSDPATDPLPVAPREEEEEEEISDEALLEMIENIG